MSVDKSLQKYISYKNKYIDLLNKLNDYDFEKFIKQAISNNVHTVLVIKYNLDQNIVKLLQEATIESKETDTTFQFNNTNSIDQFKNILLSRGINKEINNTTITLKPKDMVHLINILIRKPVPLSQIDIKSLKKPLEKPLEKPVIQSDVLSKPKDRKSIPFYTSTHLQQSQESEDKKTIPYYTSTNIQSQESEDKKTIPFYQSTQNNGLRKPLKESGIPFR